MPLEGNYCDMLKSVSLLHETFLPHVAAALPAPWAAASHCIIVNDQCFFEETFHDQTNSYYIELEVYSCKTKMDSPFETRSPAVATNPDTDSDSDDDTPLKIELQKFPGGCIINNNAYLTDLQYNTLLTVDGNLVKCAVCKLYMDIDSMHHHAEDRGHLKQMLLYPPLKKFDISVTRKIGDKYHCGVCNQLFNCSDEEDHFDGKKHEGSILYAINKAIDVLYNSEEQRNELCIDEKDWENGLMYKTNNNPDCYYFSINNIRDNESVSSDKYDIDHNDYPNYQHQEEFQNYLIEDYEEPEVPISGISYAKMAKTPKIEMQQFIEVDLGNKKVKVRFDSWHMIITPKLNRFYCMVCKLANHIRHKPEHCTQVAHLNNLKKCTVVEAYQEYFIRQVDDKLYHCGHCNNLQMIHEMQDHIERNHPKRTRIASETKNAPVKTDNVDKSDKYGRNTPTPVTPVKNTNAVKNTNPFEQHNFASPVKCNNSNKLANSDQIFANTGKFSAKTDQYPANSDKHDRNAQSPVTPVKNAPNPNPVFKTPNAPAVKTNNLAQSVKNVDTSDKPIVPYVKTNTNYQQNNKINDIFRDIKTIDVSQIFPDVHIEPFGCKMVVPMLSYNVVLRLNTDFYCGLCDFICPDNNIKRHICEVHHVELMHRTPFIVYFKYHLIRAIRDAFHCTICNDHIKADKIMSHSKESTHVEQLVKCLKYKPNDLDQIDDFSAKEIQGANKVATEINTNVAKIAKTDQKVTYTVTESQKGTANITCDYFENKCVQSVNNFTFARQNMAHEASNLAQTENKTYGSQYMTQGANNLAQTENNTYRGQYVAQGDSHSAQTENKNYGGQNMAQGATNMAQTGNNTHGGQYMAQGTNNLAQTENKTYGSQYMTQGANNLAQTENNTYGGQYMAQGTNNLAQTENKTYGSQYIAQGVSNVAQSENNAHGGQYMAQGVKNMAQTENNTYGGHVTQGASNVAQTENKTYGIQYMGQRTNNLAQTENNIYGSQYMAQLQGAKYLAQTENNTYGGKCLAQGTNNLAHTENKTYGGQYVAQGANNLAQTHSNAYGSQYMTQGATNLSQTENNTYGKQYVPQDAKTLTQTENKTYVGQCVAQDAKILTQTENKTYVGQYVAQGANNVAQTENKTSGGQYMTQGASNLAQTENKIYGGQYVTQGANNLTPSGRNNFGGQNMTQGANNLTQTQNSTYGEQYLAQGANNLAQTENKTYGGQYMAQGANNLAQTENKIYGGQYVAQGADNLAQIENKTCAKNLAQTENNIYGSHYMAQGANNLAQKENNTYGEQYVAQGANNLAQNQTSLAQFGSNIVQNAKRNTQYSYVRPNPTPTAKITEETNKIIPFSANPNINKVETFENMALKLNTKTSFQPNMPRVFSTKHTPPSMNNSAQNNKAHEIKNSLQNNSSSTKTSVPSLAKIAKTTQDTSDFAPNLTSVPRAVTKTPQCTTNVVVRPVTANTVTAQCNTLAQEIGKTNFAAEIANAASFFGQQMAKFAPNVSKITMNITNKDRLTIPDAPSNKTIIEDAKITSTATVESKSSISPTNNQQITESVPKPLTPVQLEMPPFVIPDLTKPPPNMVAFMNSRGQMSPVPPNTTPAASPPNVTQSDTKLTQSDTYDENEAQDSDEEYASIGEEQEGIVREEDEVMDATFESTMSDDASLDMEEYVYLKLKNSYIKISNTSYNTLVHIGDGSRYCFVCSEQVDSHRLQKHADSRAHLQSLEGYRFLDKYEDHLLRQNFLDYHCAICNVIITRKELKTHLEWPEHARQNENTFKNITLKKQNKNEIKGGVKQVVVSTQKENIYLNEHEPPVKICINVTVNNDKEAVAEGKTVKLGPVKRVGEVKSDSVKKDVKPKSALKKKKLIIFNDMVLKVSWENWHGVCQIRSGYKCNLCQKELRAGEVGVHCDSEWHRYSLEKPIERQYAPALIRKINESTLNCLICNTELSNKRHLVTEHVNGKRHVKNYELILAESSKTDTGYEDCDEDVFTIN